MEACRSIPLTSLLGSCSINEDKGPLSLLIPLPTSSPPPNVGYPSNKGSADEDEERRVAETLSDPRGAIRPKVDS